MKHSSVTAICASIVEDHGDTLIAILRRVYGASFAVGFDRHARLRDLSVETMSSQLALLKDHMTGALATRISIASELLDPTRARPATGYPLAM